MLVFEGSLVKFLANIHFLVFQLHQLALVSLFELIIGLLNLLDLGVLIHYGLLSILVILDFFGQFHPELVEHMVFLIKFRLDILHFP